jgi:SecD/SecF fusion protein
LGLTAVLLVLSIYVVVQKPFHLGLDINGGIRATLQAEPKPGQTIDSGTIVNVISHRIDGYGVAEPIIQPKGKDQFIVELPNVHNKEEIISELQAEAQLEFRYFKDVQSPRDPGARFTYSGGETADDGFFTDTLTHQTFRDQTQIVTDFQDQLATSNERPGASLATIPASLIPFTATDVPIYLTPQQLLKVNALGQELDQYNQLIADSPLEMTGADILPNATAGFDGQTNGPVVDLTTNADKGQEELGTFSSAHVNEMMAIILDGRVLSCAKIMGPLTEGKCEITGGFPTIKDAQNLANLLNAGALPVPLKLIGELDLDGTLGKPAVHASLIAGAIGLGAVLIFMAGYYLLPGLLADIALIIYACFTLAVFKGALGWLGLPYVTLTLPGIAGFILSVGMAVDANILIFERLKEELRNGKNLKGAIDAGFSRAFSAIRDSNACTLITCVILFSLGTSEVKGFALTLGIGVLISLFTAITVTRSLLYALITLGAGKNLALFGLGRQWEPHFNAVKNRKWFYGLSLLVIVPGIIFFSIGGLKKSIEFTGGTQVVVKLSHSFPRTQLENALAAAGFKDNLLEMGSGGDTNSTIVNISVASVDPNIYHVVGNAIAAIDSQSDVSGHYLVGPQISKELTNNAFEAVLVASCLIILYLAFAFSIGGFVAGLRFGSSAIVALVHDLLVLVGVFSIMGYFRNWQIDSLFVTALLTVVGFSVHDTIVIFDRLRENLRHRSKTESFEDLANRSIQQSFARSINTSFTVILTLVALLAFGEPSTRLLDWALLIGIISGTYSSIFNATPILVDWEMWLSRRAPQVAGAAPSPYSSVAKQETPTVRSTNGTAKSETTDDTAPRNGTAVSHSKPKKRGTSARRF